MNEYWLVEGHLGEDYFEKVDYTDIDGQIDEIEETCPACGDSDHIFSSADTLQDMIDLINQHDYYYEYKQDMIEKAKALDWED